MRLNDCLSCANHVLYENGYVMCNYHRVEEQRMTGIKDKDVIYVINCPKRDERK